MWKKALAIAVLVVLYPNIECKENQGDLKKSTDCRRTNKEAYKYCSKSCLSDRDCRKNHNCLCDGDCGMTCVRNNVKCVDPPKGKLLRIRLSNGRSFGSVVTYSCPPSYTLRGSSKRTCRSKGIWDGKKARCKKFCKDPGEIQHGSRRVDGLQVGRFIYYRCYPHYYKMEGSAKIECQDKEGKNGGNPEWSAPKPVCKVLTCPPPVIPQRATILHRQKRRKKFYAGENVQLMCSSGYSGLGTLMCNGSSWNGEIRCTPKSCGRPREVANGRIVGFLYSFKQKVQYACDEGYQLRGSSYRQCQANQEWGGDEPTCEVVDCGLLEKPDHGNIIEEVGTTYGKRIIFECAEKGYELVGSRERTCQGDGTWSGQPTTCELVKCGDPGVPLNGKRIVSKGFVYGGSVRFECNTNYTLMKGMPVAIYCQADKAWSGSLPRCLAPCPDPGVPYQATRIGHDFRHERTVRFTCPTNYRLEGIDEITCSNGRWSGRAPLCKAPCEDLAKPANGWKWGGFRHGSKVTFRCYSGYQKIGTDFTTCNDGTWTNDAPVCKGKCDRPRTPYRVRLRGNSFLDGDEVQFSCIGNRYDLFGNQIMRCVGRKWNSRIPQCKARCIFPGNPDNSFLLRAFRNRGDMIKHGERITYGCLEGYSLIGTVTRECNDGRWTNGSPVCKASCRPPGDIEHGRKIGDSYKHGERVRYQCDFGYTRDGEQELICLDGAWNFDRPICRAPCIRPERPINGGTRGDNFSHNEIVVFFCDDDYELEGDSQIICKDGSWSGSSPSCIAACPSLGELTHGRRWGDDFKDGETVTFGCNKGYDLFGTETIQCNGGSWNGSIPECKGQCVFTGDPLKAFMLDQIIQEGTHLKHGSIVELACEGSLELTGPAAVYCNDGQWNSSLPACKAACKNPGPITHGKKDGNDFSHGKHVKYKCDGNYSLEGNHQLTCHDGQWNSDPPLCKASCPILQVPSNGKANSTETKHGTLVSFSCDDGFKLQGLTHLTCVDGNWTDTTPICTVCRNPLGMENSLISDSRITSPDSRSSPNHARLNGKFSWCATEQTYLQIDLGKHYKLTAVATQGGQSYNGVISWVQRYKISFFAGPRTEIYYSESETPEAIEGNQDNSSIKTYVLKEPFVTKVVRIYPSFDLTPVCLRMELYGCEPKPDCIHVGSVVWGLWERNLALSMLHYYLAYITKLNATHVDFVLDYYVDKALTRSYNRTEPVLVIDKIPEMKDISVGSRVIGVHRETHKEWYQTGTVTSIPDSRYVSVRFDRGVTRRWIPLDELRLLRRPRFCTNGA
ncbi:sushi, von Willebrand factor type A, EGF and pentraxin domain-containing protein 1-like [Montipora capricornis]|uniref:sushi, von Willebrand factor type A, EGF and pentraxin domain-containing protein 1-like n=1 Tax=Montipora capricornis TaxID=246305 RepID=UPI0035F1022A